MKIVDSATEAVILSPERTITGQVDVDWLNDGFTPYDKDYYWLEKFATFDVNQWALSGSASFDAANHRVVVPTKPKSELTSLVPRDMNYCRTTVYVTPPTLTPSTLTRQFSVYLTDFISGHYAEIRNDASGVYLSVSDGSGTVHDSMGFWPAGTVITRAQFDVFPSQIIVTFESPTTGVVNTTYFTTLNFSNATIGVRSYTANGTDANSNLYVTSMEYGNFRPLDGLDTMTERSASMSVDRAITRTLPDEVSAFEGSAVAQTSADLTGALTEDEAEDVIWTFSDINTESPLYDSVKVGSPIKSGIRVYDEDGYSYVDIPKMVGTVRDINTSAKNHTADLTALDYREALSGTVTLPPIDGLAHGLNATALVSYALTMSGVNTSPPPRPNSKLWAPMHGTAFPFIYGGDTSLPTGRYYLPGESTVDGGPPNDRLHIPPFVDGPFVKALGTYTNSSSDFGLFIENFTDASEDYSLDLFSQQNGAGVCSFWFQGMPGAASSTASWDLVRVSIGSPNNQTYLEFGLRDSRIPRIALKYPGTNGGIYTMDGTAMAADSYWNNGGWYYAMFAWNMAPGGEFDLRILSQDGAQLQYTAYANTFPGLPAALPLRDNWMSDQTQFYARVPVAEINLAALDQSKNTYYRDNPMFFRSGAELDDSALDLDVNFDTTTRECWGLIGEIAQAENAAVYFDEMGKFRYSTRRRRVEPDALDIQRTMTTLDDITEVQFAKSIDNVRNQVNASYTPVTLTRNTVVFSTTDTIVLPAGLKTRVTFAFSNPLVDLWVGEDMYNRPPIYWDNAFSWPEVGAPIGMACARKSTKAWASGDGVTPIGMDWPKVTHLDANSIEIEFSNRYKFPVFIFNDGYAIDWGGDGSNLPRMQALGSPSLMLAGDIYTKGSQAITMSVTDSYSVHKYSANRWLDIPRTLDLPSSQWYQSETIAYSTAGAVLSDTKDAVAVATVDVIGDPRLQLGDRIALRDPEGVRINGEFWIDGITEAQSAGDGYTQQLQLRQAHSILYWANDTTHTPPQDTWDDFGWG